MTKEEILYKHCNEEGTFYHLTEDDGVIDGDIRPVFKAMDEYAEQEAVGFFLWYAMKMMAFIEYIQDIRPRVESHEIEEKIQEFEGKPIKELYQLYIQDKQKQLK